MSAIFDIGTILHWLACVGVFLANFLIYEFVVFGGWMLAIMPFMKSDRISEETEQRIMDIGIVIAIMIFAVLIVFYTADVFRLIPLPKK